jgi:hypothetical protein
VPRYSDERKEAVLRKMLPPHNRPLTELVLRCDPNDMDSGIPIACSVTK